MGAGVAEEGRASDRSGVPNGNDLAAADDASEVDNGGGGGFGRGAGDVGAGGGGFGAASRGQEKSFAR